MKLSFVLLLALLFILGLSSCKKNITEPDLNSPQPGRRDYVWTEDTICSVDHPDMVVVRMWGHKPNDIWYSSTNSSFYTNLWHYDGRKVSVDSVFRPINSPWALFGFSANDVWLSSYDNEIWHYDGSEWKRFGIYIKEGYEFITIMNFWGKSPDDIYAVGLANDRKNPIGIIMHFDGKDWTFLDIPDINYCFNDIRFKKSANTYYIEAFAFDISDSSKYYSLKDGSLKEIYCTHEIASINNIEDEVYFVIGKKIYKRINESFQLWKDYSDQLKFNQIWGTSEQNCFHETYNGIAHYNGKDLELLYKTKNTICEGLIFENEVFFLTYNFYTMNNIIIRGRLKEVNE